MKSRAAGGRMKHAAGLDLTVQYATDKPWVPSRHLLSRWAGAALGPRAAARDLTVRVVGSAESRRLNRSYRQRDKSTNVLSFPATVARVDGRRPLGDLVLCAPVIAREAQAQAKRREAHWAHMIVHGALHLVGYDHERPKDAQRMERREVRVLKRLGFPDPYRSV